MAHSKCRADVAVVFGQKAYTATAFLQPVADADFVARVQHDACGCAVT